MIKDFIQALLFLTRLPVPLPNEMPTPDSQGRAVLFFPLVGLVVGVILVVGYWLLADISSLLQAALLLSVWVALTGALHLDGLADLADAWIGGLGDRERTLEIMKDPRSGPMAVVAVALLLLLKLAALDSLLAAHQWSALLLVPVIGRAGLVAALLYIPYVRANGLGNSMASHLPSEKARLILVVVALVGLLAWGWDGLWLLLILLMGFLWLRHQIMGRLQGMTGDCAGAVCELLEALALIGLALLAGTG